MDGILELSVSSLAYGDPGTTNNPARRYFDWSRRSVRASQNPSGQSYTVPSGSSISVFNGTRSTGVGAATEFVLAVSPVPGAVGRYRMTWDTVGQNPALRTDRSLTLSGHVLTWTANANLTATVVATAGDFTAVVIGDSLFIPDTSTGDAAYPGNLLNAGSWVVIGKSIDSSTVQLGRPAGAPWSGASEVFTPSTNAQVIAFSAAGVQVGDGVNLSAGFLAPVLGTYVVLAVTPTRFEFQTAKPLPVAAVAVPGTAGIAFFSSYKSFVMVNADQDCHLQLNGAAGNGDTMSPSTPGDQDFVANFIKEGPCWSLSVVNDSLDVLNVFVASGE